MKLMRALAVFALVLGFAVPVYAETQNVKVSGSLDAYWFYRSEYDLNDSNDASVLAAPATTSPTSGTTLDRSSSDDFFMSQAQVEVSADLTDNVSTVINLLNERDWNADVFRTAGTSAATAENAGAEYDVILDLAYVQMKEIFYSPLTLTIGRQDIWLGRGFIIGNNNKSWDSQATIQANEYSTQTAFDAVRATLDFNPWTIDLAYSKILENAHNSEDDIDLYIANVNYKFAEYNAVAEAYYVGEFDKATLQTAAGGTKDNDTNTVGARVQFDPISQITLGAELAYQFGDYRTAVTNATARDREAWGANIFGTYRFDYTWKPEVTLEYVLFSGESDMSSTSTQSYGAWNGLYRGKFWTAYGDFREFVYGTTDPVDQPATTNQQFIHGKASMKPLDDLLIEASLTYFWNDADVNTTASNPTSPVRSDDIGWEVDLQAVYDYTEDVSFGIVAGWFVPGDFYSNPNDETATDVVSSVKVTF